MNIRCLFMKRLFYTIIIHYYIKCKKCNFFHFIIWNFSYYFVNFAPMRYAPQKSAYFAHITLVPTSSNFKLFIKHWKFASVIFACHLALIMKRDRYTICYNQIIFDYFRYRKTFANVRSLPIAHRKKMKAKTLQICGHHSRQ